MTASTEDALDDPYWNTTLPAAVLGTSQAERLQVLFTLTRRGWRVVSAHDVEVIRPGRSLRCRDLDEIDDESLAPGEVGLASQLLLATAGPRAQWRTG